MGIVQCSHGAVWLLPVRKETKRQNKLEKYVGPVTTYYATGRL